MVGYHHQVNGYEFEQISRENREQRSLVGSSPWGRKEYNMTKRINKLIVTKEKWGHKLRIWD